MKRVLITGATGFLGKHLVERFKKEGFEVTAFGRNAVVLNQMSKQGIQIISGDLRNPTDLVRATAKKDVVVHAGALSTVWGSWNDFYKTNVLGTRNVIQACLESKVERLIFVSSPSVYTSLNDRYDIKENEFNESNELNFYIKSKILAEKEVRKGYEQGLYSIILRPRGLFGIGDTSVIPRLLEANDKFGVPLINNGENIVDITYVENVVEAIFLAVSKQDINGEVFNITNGEPTPFKELLSKLLVEVGLKPKFMRLKFSTLFKMAKVLEMIYSLLRIKKEPVLTKYTVATLGFSQTLDISNARMKLGYRPIYSLEEGVKKYGEWYRRHH